uniref:Ribonuclease A-domain domain-containing protein n=1 Tax=Malurus cyaneus samueli TaxID=2593467 RepID=A0A8C5X4A5_9PASS
GASQKSYFLLILPGTCCLPSLTGAQGQSYQAFAEARGQPPDPLPARNYCNIMMARRGMTSMTVARACSRRPDAQGYYTTPNRLSVTICRLSGGSTRPPCNYRVAQQRQHYVEVACQGGLPVHLQNTFP